MVHYIDHSNYNLNSNILPAGGGYAILTNWKKKLTCPCVLVKYVTNCMGHIVSISHKCSISLKILKRKFTFSILPSGIHWWIYPNVTLSGHLFEELCIFLIIKQFTFRDDMVFKTYKKKSEHVANWSSMCTDVTGICLCSICVWEHLTFINSCSYSILCQTAAKNRMYINTHHALTTHFCQRTPYNYQFVSTALLIMSALQNYHSMSSLT